jgi:hypothetical protein
MKKNFIILSLFCIAIGSISLDILDDNGKAGKTGSPGETTCNTSGCHTGNAVNETGGSVTIDCPTMTNWNYVPGQTYTVNVTVERSGINLFGLGFEALTATGANAGSFVITNTTQNTTKSANISGNLRTSVVHKLNGGASSNSHTFSFNWVAPTSDIGPITFYVAGNAANANGSDTGDFIYTASQLVTSPSTGDLENQKSIPTFNVYPNPATEIISIAYQLQEKSDVYIKLISLTGQIVYNMSILQKGTGNQIQPIQVHNEMPKGVYFVELTIKNKSFTQKVICN